jgi:hypothetical protein
MRRDILDAIRSEKDVTNAIVVTHNIDFVFIQTVVLAALRSCGHPSLTVFADAGCASAAFAYQAPVLQGLGVRYRVVPVEMKGGFRFHPKAALLSGPSSGTLYVGSGNLTFGGWKENAEVWTSFDTRSDGTSAFAAFLRFLRAVTDLVALRDAVRAEIDEAFDPKTRPWAAELAEPAGLLWKVGGGPPLLDRILGQVGDGPVDAITICSPYFDEDAEALSAVARRSRAGDVTVLVQPGRTGLTEGAWKRASDLAHLAPITAQREDDHGRPREAFVHAKFYAFHRAGRVAVFAGSANCSRAALTIPGADGNAELMAIRNLDDDAFRESFTSELVPKEGAPGLASRTPDAPEPAVTTIRILGASYEAGCLTVAYAPRNQRITICEVDGVRVAFESGAEGLLRVRLDRAPRNVVLGCADGPPILRSAPSWVDHEWELRSTARGRSVAEAIRSHVQAGEWDLGAWSELLATFCSHVRYLPPRSTSAEHSESKDDQNGKAPVRYTMEDVFAAEYAPPRLSHFLVPLPGNPTERVRSLQQLLLRWFGVSSAGGEDDEVRLPAVDADADPGNEETVDRPEDLPPTAPPAAAAKPNDRERRKAVRLTEQLSEAMTSPDFLRDRPPELLAADLKIASALLRIALREGWLEADAFLSITHSVWSALFFDADGTDDRGWLQRRFESAKSANDFAAPFRSPDMIAALAAWAMAVAPGGPMGADARFRLAAAMAVARLPWLWDGMDDREVRRELADLLRHTVSSPERAARELDAVDETWLLLLQRGHALRRLEAAVAGLMPMQLAPRVEQKWLVPGEFVWQGTAGFCVVTSPAERAPKNKVNVLRLRGKRDETRFAAEHTVPVAALLDGRVVPLTEEFGPRPREVLRTFLLRLAEGFAGAQRRADDANR